MHPSKLGYILHKSRLRCQDAALTVSFANCFRTNLRSQHMVSFELYSETVSLRL